MASEFSLIEQYFSFSSEDDQLVCSVGDDGALLKPSAGMEQIWSTDSLVEGVHFLPQVSPGDLAFKAIAVNVSDIAAMGGRARWVSLALSLPRRFNDADWLGAFSQGLKKACEVFGVRLVGGDTTRCEQLVISVSILGEVAQGQAVRRSGGVAEQGIFVTGHLGLAGAGLNLALTNQVAQTPFEKAALNRLHRPEPRVELGQALAGKAGAMLDVSDGFLADLNHLCQASKLGAELDLAQWPLARGAPALDLGGQAFWHAMSQGDDYELLFSLDASLWPWLDEYKKTLDYPVTQVGRFIATPGIYWKGQRVEPLGYQHF